MRHGNPLVQRILLVIVLAALTVAACGAPPQAAAPAPSPAPRAALERQPFAGGPTLLRDGVALRKVASVNPGAVGLAHNPTDGALYMLSPGNGIYRIDVQSTTEPVLVAAASAISDGNLAGMTIGPDGVFYVTANRPVGDHETQAIVRRGRPGDGGFTWQTLATTAPYPLSGTPFDHVFNGLAVSPDGQWLFVNSGSRTDHGEVQSNDGVFPNTREVALTARVFRLPIDATDLSLPNDEAALEAQKLVFARGTRNAYDMAFAPNGELFAVDNGPDADYPDELNWLQEGRHYGFPWRFGDMANKQQFANYDSSKDKLLSDDFTAVKSGTYRNDPDFPPPPGPFAEPIANRGPAATQYRAEDGSQREAAAEGKPLFTFTPHRSPLGLVFAGTSGMPADLRSAEGSLSAFVLSWGAAGGTLSDAGQDVLHIVLTKQGDNYVATTEQFARGFKNPIDAVLVENRLYVLEFGPGAAIWELTFS
ncbi:MAG: PQQ-dependent sugar dehydrogenase [Chloroflexaceae bacterium]|jgi:glucose/arabinose dehydrogenase|nr:PQQ-dependent sugar dehydrogenase [Chloroflexaceae bacterium]